MLGAGCKSALATSETVDTDSKKYQDWVRSVNDYKKHYNLPDVYEKKVDNQGNGDEDLYGVRNFRAVLYGVYYRGGANNVYNKNLKRDNQNPLQKEALVNLCKENFSTSLYFYTTNASSMQLQTTCETADKNKNTLNYQQISALEPDNQIKILKMIHQHIVEMDTKPIYGHCWNGWHASGLIATLSLMQFCKFNNKEALNYWMKNTDNNNKKYFQIKKRISTFKRLPELEIDEKYSKVICPTSL